jgi:hypothetical protein
MLLVLGARQLSRMLLELRLCALVIVGLPLGSSLGAATGCRTLPIYIDQDY